MRATTPRLQASAAARALALAARARICAHFDLATMVARYELLYESILEQTPCAA